MAELNAYLTPERTLFAKLPPYIASPAIKANMMRFRKNNVTRTVENEALNKTLTDWTLPRLVIRAQKE